MTDRSYLDETLLAMKAQGLSTNKMAKALGVTRNVVAGRLWRITKPRAEQNPRRRAGPPPLSWDEKLFEPYAAFKARKQKERQCASNVTT